MAEEPGQADLCGSDLQVAGGGDHGGLVGHLRQAVEGAAEGEERHPRDALGETQPQHVLVVAREQAVGVLHAGDAGGESPAQPVERDTAEADRTDLALVAQCRHHGELVVEVDDLVAFGAQAGPVVRTAQIDERDLFESEGGQVVLDTCAQLLGTLREAQRKGAIGVGGCSDLADHHDVLLGADGLADHIVDESMAVELGGVDVVDPQLDGAAQQRHGRLAVAREAFELHRAEADAGDGAAGELPGSSGAPRAGGRVLERSGGRGHGGVPFS